jgi:hypothetical protein
MSYSATFARTKPTYAPAEATSRRARLRWKRSLRAGEGSKRADPPRARDGLGLANVSGTELTDGWVRPET